MHKTSPLPHKKNSPRAEVEMSCLKIKAFFWATPAPGKVPSDPIVLLLGNYSSAFLCSPELFSGLLPCFLTPGLGSLLASSSLGVGPASPAHSLTSLVQTLRQRSSLVVQGLRFCTFTSEGPGSICGQGTRSHMLQLRPSAGK